MKKKIKTIAVIGLGLMGSSLAHDLKKKSKNLIVLGVSRKEKTIARAKKLRIIDGGSSDYSAVIPRADLIVVCTPVDRIIPTLKKIDPLAKPGALVTDVGSVKAEIVAQARAGRFRNIRFVGSHPMVGSHERGLGAIKPGLYRGGFCFVVPTPDRSVSQAVVSFWKSLGMRVELTNENEHDRVVARISHLPHALAALLVRRTAEKMLACSGAGFRDMTRIAEGDPTLWNAILSGNRGNLARELRSFASELSRFAEVLRKNKISQITQTLRDAHRKRSRLG